MNTSTTATATLVSHAILNSEYLTAAQQHIMVQKLSQQSHEDGPAKSPHLTIYSCGNVASYQVCIGIGSTWSEVVWSLNSTQISVQISITTLHKMNDRSSFCTVCEVCGLEHCIEILGEQWQSLWSYSTIIKRLNQNDQYLGSLLLPPNIILT